VHEKPYMNQKALALLALLLPVICRFSFKVDFQQS